VLQTQFSWLTTRHADLLPTDAMGNVRCISCTDMISAIGGQERPVLFSRSRIEIQLQEPMRPSECLCDLRISILGIDQFNKRHAVAHRVGCKCFGQLILEIAYLRGRVIPRAGIYARHHFGTSRHCCTPVLRD